jgi:uncharacterized membrane protein
MWGSVYIAVRPGGAVFPLDVQLAAIRTFFPQYIESSST